MTLTQLGCKYGTDKADYHEFTDFYQQYFDTLFPPHGNPPTILEIGVLEGASLRMYDDFFNERATIVGVDITEKDYIFKGHPRISTLCGDIVKPETIDLIRNAVPGGMYDVIIDDGGHTMEQQQIALLRLWDSVKPGGLFIMEDLHTSRLPEYNPTNTTTTLDLLNSITDDPTALLQSQFITKEQMQKLHREIYNVQVYTNNRESGQVSITSVIQKDFAVTRHRLV